jgi:methyl-accepting chemotaxis protein
MGDRSIEQINQSIDRLLEISAENTRNIAELSNTVCTIAGAVERLATLTDQRLNRQDQLIRLLSAYITGTPPNEAA